MKNTIRKFRAHKDAMGAVSALLIFAIGGFVLACEDLIPWPLVDKFGWLFILFGVLAVWDWWATSYEFDQEELIIHSGLSRQRINLCNVEELQARGKALRLKCQQLRGSRWFTLLPQNRQAFLERLNTKCPWLGRV